MSKTLEEFIALHTPVQDLRINLRANLDAMTELTEEEKDDLDRVNMIMVRQCLRDFGVE